MQSPEYQAIEAEKERQLLVLDLFVTHAKQGPDLSNPKSFAASYAVSQHLADELLPKQESTSITFSPAAQQELDRQHRALDAFMENSRGVNNDETVEEIEARSQRAEELALELRPREFPLDVEVDPPVPSKKAATEEPSYKISPMKIKVIAAIAIAVLALSAITAVAAHAFRI